MSKNGEVAQSWKVLLWVTAVVLSTPLATRCDRALKMKLSSCWGLIASAPKSSWNDWVDTPADNPKKR